MVECAHRFRHSSLRTRQTNAARFEPLWEVNPAYERHARVMQSQRYRDALFRIGMFKTTTLGVNSPITFRKATALCAKPREDEW